MASNKDGAAYAFSHVLLATDGSTSSCKAEDYALFLANKFNIKLTIVYVLEDKLCHYGEVDTLAPLEARESFITYVIDEQKMVANEIAKALTLKAKNHNNIKYAFKAKQGEPANIISKIAEDENADLILLGGKRFKKKRRFRLISLADKLTYLTERSILTII